MFGRLQVVSSQHLRLELFPFSHVAEKAEMQRNETRLAMKQNTTPKMTMKEIEDASTFGYRDAVRAIPHELFECFLSILHSPQQVYFFERELEAWKAEGIVAELQVQVDQLKSELIRNHSSSDDTEQKAINDKFCQRQEQLESVDWHCLDFWREVRLIRSMKARRVLLESQPRELECKYPIIVVPTADPNSLIRSYLRLFFRGMTVDALDGKLLYIDKSFLLEAFTPHLCSLELENTNPGAVFVVSTLGVQSTGKSSLLNNLFGCNMPVSTGRTTRGKNICHVAVYIPDCSIKHIIVQDFEGLMTIDRGGTTFDRNVTLHAMATSDLVLLNMSKVIDGPTTELLRFAVFAFEHLGLYRYRKPSLAFILRDMANADLSEFSTTKIRIEEAMTEFFRAQDESMTLLDIMREPHYRALASAIHRKELWWLRSILGLRTFIFDNIREKHLESMNPVHERKNPAVLQSFNIWAQNASAVWDCIRESDSLFEASTLMELQFKTTMENALQKSLESPDTIVRAVNILRDWIDKTLDESGSGDSAEKQQSFEVKLETEFVSCHTRTLSLFTGFVGVRERIPPAYLRTYDEFIDVEIPRNINQHKGDVKRMWMSQKQDKEEARSLRNALASLIQMIVNNNDRLDQLHAELRFAEVWTASVARVKAESNRLFSESKLTDTVNTSYETICLRHHIDQPSNFENLSDKTKIDLSSNALLMKSIAATAPTGRRAQIINFLTLGLTEIKDHGWSGQQLNQVLPVLVNRLTNLIREKTAAVQLVSLNTDIRQTVHMLESELKRINDELVYAEKGALTPEFHMAAHRHLYRAIINRVKDLASSAKRDMVQRFEDHEIDIKTRYVSSLTKQFNDGQTSQQIVTQLTKALVAYAGNRGRLHIRQEDVSQLLSEREYFREIRSPENVEQLCYDRVFTRVDDKELLRYLKDRAAFLRDVWCEKFNIGKNALLADLRTDVATFFVGPNNVYDKLQSRTLDWMQDHQSQEGQSADDLLTYLQAEPLLSFLMNDESAILIRGNTLASVATVLERLPHLWPAATILMAETNAAIDHAIVSLCGDIGAASYGCEELCPYCYTKCQFADGHSGRHKCNAHLVAGFGGCLDVNSNKLTTSYCTGSSFRHKWRLKTDDQTSGVSFLEHIATNYPGWDIKKEGPELPPMNMREAFERINTELAHHYGATPGVLSWETDT